jgi:polar amino acid transport system substrate-binding protein
MTQRFATAFLLIGALTAGYRSAWAEDLSFVAGQIPPYAFKEDGKPNGPEPLIIEAITKEFGLPFKMRFQPWVRAQMTAQREKNIGIVPLSRTPEREALYKWVGPFVYDQEVLVTVSSDKKAPTSLDEAKDWSVCDLRGSPGDAKLKSLGFTHLFAATDTATCAHMLAAKQVDAWSSGIMPARYLFKLSGFDPATLSMGAKVRDNDTYLGFSRDVDDDVVARWQKSLDRMRADGRISTLMKSFE